MASNDGERREGITGGGGRGARVRPRKHALRQTHDPFPGVPDSRNLVNRKI
jgi:hypothetical protein